MDDYCYRCGGDRWLVSCVDDLCHGNRDEGCMHGDGYRPCPACNPDGEVMAPIRWNVDYEALP